jgi:hypothetical protein
MMKISVKLVALHLQLSILTFLLVWRSFGLEIVMLLTVGRTSTDDAFHQFQQMLPEPVVTLVAFMQQISYFGNILLSLAANCQQRQSLLITLYLMCQSTVTRHAVMSHGPS